MRRAREIWVNVIRQFEKSGLKQEEFAAERKIPVGTLRRPPLGRAELEK